MSAIDNNLKKKRKHKEFLSKANENTDLKKIRDALEELDDLNKEVMLKIGDRYNPLLQGKMASEKV